MTDPIITNPIADIMRESRKEAAAHEARARALRPAYFARLDAMLASGAFAVEDHSKTRPPTGRRYAD